jgi:uncharacterized membrane protein YqiK
VNNRKKPENYQWDLSKIKGLARAGELIAMNEGIGDPSNSDTYLVLFRLIRDLSAPIQEYMADVEEVEEDKIVSGDFRR